MLEVPSARADAEQSLDPVQAERCWRLIAVFDEIVVNRFDYRLLAIEDSDLADARRLRQQAEIDCATGDLWFGVDAIEEALFIIGFVPWDAERTPLAQ